MENEPPLKKYVVSQMEKLERLGVPRNAIDAAMKEAAREFKKYGGPNAITDIETYRLSGRKEEKGLLITGHCPGDDGDYLVWSYKC